jgi:predicted anti-sigma-YlaC factor YlaD
MSQIASGDEHVRLWLGLYVLGALSTQEHAVVAEHLDRCAQCQAESDELAQVPAFLSLLSDEDVRILADEFGTPDLLDREDSFDALDPVPPPPSIPRSLSPVSFPRKLRNLTGAARSGRLVLAALMVTLVAGIGIGVWLQASSSGPPAATTLAASATDTVSGASLSVVVVGQNAGSQVQATVKSLRVGVQYQLIGVSVRGQTEVVAQWVGSDGSQNVEGKVEVPPQDLAFFTVTQLDGAVVVSVRFAPTASATS